MKMTTENIIKEFKLRATGMRDLEANARQSADAATNLASEHAKVASLYENVTDQIERFDVTPVLSFDGETYWLDVVGSCQLNDDGTIAIRFGSEYLAEDRMNLNKERFGGLVFKNGRVEIIVREARVSEEFKMEGNNNA